jgi:hypothetical protein
MEGRTRFDQHQGSGDSACIASLDSRSERFAQPVRSGRRTLCPFGRSAIECFTQVALQLEGWWGKVAGYKLRPVSVFHLDLRLGARRLAWSYGHGSIEGG